MNSENNMLAKKEIVSERRKQQVERNMKERKRKR